MTNPIVAPTEEADPSKGLAACCITKPFAGLYLADVGPLVFRGISTARQHIRCNNLFAASADAAAEIVQHASAIQAEAQTGQYQKEPHYAVTLTSQDGLRLPLLMGRFCHAEPIFDLINKALHRRKYLADHYGISLEPLVDATPMIPVSDDEKMAMSTMFMLALITEKESV
ncbi:hypothetical protein D3C87_348080 [compost metagenome]